MCERLSCETCKAHLPRPCSSSVPPPAPPASPSAAQWGLMMHGLRHANSMACECLARFARFTRRASSSPALLALLPLQDDLLRERPTPLRPNALSVPLIMSVTEEQTHCTHRFGGANLTRWRSIQSGEAPATCCTHTPCSDACPERELHETCLVLTDDTRLARPKMLEDVGDNAEGRLVTKDETRSPPQSVTCGGVSCETTVTWLALARS